MTSAKFSETRHARAAARAGQEPELDRRAAISSPSSSPPGAQSGPHQTHIVDFQAHLDAARRPIDTYATWGAAYQIMDGLCSGDGFWYFQPWLIGQGREWHERAVRNPHNLADVPGVRALAGRRCREWSDAEWPWWEER